MVISAAFLQHHFSIGFWIYRQEYLHQTNYNRKFSPKSMAAIPNGAFAACKARQNRERESPELTPVKYNSKLMDSIWGMYNRYSPYNFKKNNPAAAGLFEAGYQLPVDIPAAMEQKSMDIGGAASGSGQKTQQQLQQQPQTPWWEIWQSQTQ